MNWMVEQLETLHRLYERGLSQSRIAREVGCTRNAVAGKIFRLGLHRNERPKQGRPKVASPMWLERLARERAAKEPDYPKQPPMHPKPRKPVTFAELQPHHCRWPFGDDPSKQTYCGDERLPGKSYCDYHHKIAHVKYTPRSKAADT